MLHLDPSSLERPHKSLNVNRTHDSLCLCVLSVEDQTEERNQPKIKDGGTGQRTQSSVPMRGRALFKCQGVFGLRTLLLLWLTVISAPLSTRNSKKILERLNIFKGNPNTMNPLRQPPEGTEGGSQSPTTSLILDHSESIKWKNISL